MAKNWPLMSTPLRGISSMATRQVLAELAAAHHAHSGRAVHFESVGGLDAAKRVLAGEPFDLVVLASDAIAKLMPSGAVLAGSRVDLVKSPVALAVKAGAPLPDISSEEAVRQAVLAVLAVSKVGYSTGPSGAHLRCLFERWGLGHEFASRTLQAPSGVPVASLLARGDVALGFQQLSELMNVDGVAVIGVLPPAISFITTFSAAVCRTCTQVPAVQSLLSYLTSPQAEAIKLRHGMSAA